MAKDTQSNPETVIPGFGCQVFDKDNLTDEEKAQLEFQAEPKKEVAK